MRILILFFVIGLISCGETEKKQTDSSSTESLLWQMPDTAAYVKMGKAKLSDYGFFKGNLSLLNPTDRVFPYEINSPLFSDYAQKKRFIYLPKGKQLKYKEKNAFDFPEGSILIKNFYFDDDQLSLSSGRIIETRLLIKELKGWKSLPYVWNDLQTEAFLEIPGREVALTLSDNKKEMLYAIPTMLQCKSCHDTNGKIEPIGPTARQLNKDGQLEKLIEKGWLVDVPEKQIWPKMVAWQDTTALLNERARAYLDVNCGHCHKTNGPAKNSGLDLKTSASNSLAMGIYKAPVAAGKGSGGLKYDIVPGQPDQSIMVYRMQSIDPAIMMPEIGKAVVHSEGVKLIEEWITSLNKTAKH